MAAAAQADPPEWTAARSVAGNRNPWSIVAVISIATFMTVLDISITNVALDHIAGALAVSYDQATWVTTGFLAATAIVIPISGWLANVIGRKRYYMISVALFTFASFLCGISSNLTMLIAARVLQGAAGGGLAAVEQSMLVDTFAPRRRSMAFAVYGIVVIAGPVIGPVIGGLITDNYSWNWCFFINIPVGILSLMLVQRFVEEPAALEADRAALLKNGLKVDIIGFALSALFLGLLEVTLDRGQTDDWFASPFIRFSTIVAAVSFCLFIPWELTRADPIVPIRMFAQRNFAIASLFLMITGIIIFGTTQFIPQLLQQVLGYTATNAGLALGAGGLATIVMMPLSGLLSSRLDPRLLIGFAFVVEGLALWNMAGLDTQMSFTSAALARMYQSAGLPFLFVPITTMAYIGLKPSQSNQASALMNVARNLGGTIGISTAQTMLARRQQFHQARLVESLGPINPVYVRNVARISHALMAHGQPNITASRGAVALVYHDAVNQAAMLSYVDVFHTLMWVVFGSIPLLLLMRGPDSNPSGDRA